MRIYKAILKLYIFYLAWGFAVTPSLFHKLQICTYNSASLLLVLFLLFGGPEHNASMFVKYASPDSFLTDWCWVWNFHPSLLEWCTVHSSVSPKQITTSPACTAITAHTNSYTLTTWFVRSLCHDVKPFSVFWCSPHLHIFLFLPLVTVLLSCNSHGCLFPSECIYHILLLLHKNVILCYDLTFCNWHMNFCFRCWS